VGSLFGLMEDYDKVWKETQGSVPTPMYGFRYTVGLEPVRVNPERIMEAFRLGVRDLGSVYESFLQKDLVSALQQLAQAPPEKFILEDSTWVAELYDFAAAFHRRTIDRKHLLQSLTPLYLGWVASYIVRTQTDSDDDAEQKIEQLALAYEQLKTRLAERW
ncbi:MAG TPA: hypothetical protein VLB32_07005, partial [Candidatus Acidoferrales bacterium]|nr:hypothetical protein [Candidatus Acidoferrales bacterium]